MYPDNTSHLFHVRTANGPYANAKSVQVQAQSDARKVRMCVAYSHSAGAPPPEGRVDDARRAQHQAPGTRLQASVHGAAQLRN
jgi:hypothetical protein